jgi:transcription antitermination factor NusA-like protein
MYVMPNKQREAQFVLEFAFPGQFAQVEMPAAAVHAICSTSYISALALSTNTEITTDAQCGCVRVRSNTNNSSSSSSGTSAVEAAIKQLNDALQQWRKLHGVVKFEAWMLPSIIGHDANRFLNIRPISVTSETATVDNSDSSTAATTNDDITTADTSATTTTTDDDARAERVVTSETVDSETAKAAVNGRKKQQRQQQQQRERVNISCDRSALEFNVTGKTAAAVTSVCEQLQVQLQELAKEHAVVSIPVDAIARLVGRQGSNIKALQTETSARFDIDSRTGVVHITGKEHAVLAATEKLQAFATAWQHDHTALTISVPEKLMPTVIGRGGADIRALQEKCRGVQIDIDKTESTVQLYGNADGVACAQQHIQAILDADTAQQAAAKQARADRAATVAAAKLQQQQQQQRQLEQQKQQRDAAVAAATAAAATAAAAAAAADSAAAQNSSDSSKMVIRTDDADVLNGDNNDGQHEEQQQSLGTTSSDATDHDDEYDDNTSEQHDTTELQHDTHTATTAAGSTNDVTKHNAEYSVAPTTAVATTVATTTAATSTAALPSFSALTSMLFGSSSPAPTVTPQQHLHKPLQSLLPTAVAPQKATAVTASAWTVPVQAKTTTTTTTAAASSLTSLTDLLMKGSNSTTATASVSNGIGTAVAAVDARKAAVANVGLSNTKPKSNTTAATTSSSDSDRYYISKSGVKLRL